MTVIGANPNERGSGPTVVLVGGTMTAEDGKVLDSRQRVAKDPQSRVMRSSLAGSMYWWGTVVSLVEPLLRSAGEDAFALIIGSRTVIELQADGSIRRTRLRAVIPGGLSAVEITRTGPRERLAPHFEHAGSLGSWSGGSMGEVGLAYSEPRRRWRVLDGNEWYLQHAAPALRPAVIVDTTDSVLLETSFEALITRRLFDEQIALVLPHTHAAERHLKAYAGLRDSGSMAHRAAASVPWDPEAPPDPMGSTTLVPIDADFGVTGLVQHQEWKDPSDLEAARSLLQARFDLRIGIWDLVQQPLLRRTLLGDTTTAPKPAGRAHVPATAADRARRAVDTRVQDTRDAKVARETILALCNPPLWDAGWRRRWHGDFCFEQFGDALRRYDCSIEPVAFLALTIGKRQSTVVVHSVFRSAAADERLREQADRLAEIAEPGVCSLTRSQLVLCRQPGGWADEVDWPTRAADLAERTRPWVSVLQPFVEACRSHHGSQVAGYDFGGAHRE